MLPKETISHNIESLYDRHNRKVSVIYLSSIFAILLGLISLPFISVIITVQSTAIIRPSSEISSLRSLVNGRLKESFASENRSVEKGETLFVVESEIIFEREKNLASKIDEAGQFIHDYKVLLNTVTEFKSLKTPLLQQSLSSYKQKVFEATTRYNKTNADYTRNKKLHNEKVIADSEFENFQFELDKAANDLELAKQNQLGQWQNELRSYEKELLELNGELAQLGKEKDNLIIKAPVSGNIQNMAGLYPGSMVFTNQDLAQISPDTTLLVEAYISPNDIGLVQPAMPARFQVNAFNYNQWGLATGKVIEISNDIHIMNDQPVFKVKCILDKDYLQLKNGYKGYLKKGMTLQARFMVTERTLWQLLYDKVDDWVNPNTYVK